MSSIYTVQQLCDLVSSPVQYVPMREKNPNQETQVFPGESVLILENENEWTKVELPEQRVFDVTEGWIGYRGWIRKKHLIELSQSTVKKAINSFSEEVVDLIVEEARSYLNEPYLWGGRSHYSKQYESYAPYLTGCDCSGLVYNAYKKAGVYLPRNAKDQFKMCAAIDGKDLCRGDLIFEKPHNKNNITHVILYIGEGNCIEATLRTCSVHIFHFEEFFQKDIHQTSASFEMHNSLYFIRRFI